VAFETLHHMQNTQTGKTGQMALKLNMSKAYDRVEWNFLTALMGKMSFHPKFISIITEYISTVSYSILINGAPHGNFKPFRGIRHGDPLSPYLFILYAKGLYNLLQKSESEGSIHGVSLCRSGPKLTHLFFADDSLLFCRAKIEECRHLQEILSLYEAASGQQLNKEKTTLFFSKNTPQSDQLVIKDLLNVPAIHSSL
jgi:hypothetical protein